MKVDPAWVLGRHRRERDELLARAQTFVAGLPAGLDVRAVVVFGSVARGDFNKWSDVDVLVVAEGASGTPMERHAHLEPVPGRVQPVVWTRAELNERLARGDPIAVEAMEMGRWLQGAPGELG